MQKIADYYMSPSSPWTYLGHARFGEIAHRDGITVRVKPIDYGVIFPESGGLPLPKRAPQRQAYRLVELRRWGAQLGIPINVQPKRFPVDARPAAFERIGAQHGVANAAAAIQSGEAAFRALTEEALRHGVFGAPTYVVGDELFWGQDRLEFVERALARG